MSREAHPTVRALVASVLVACCLVVPSAHAARAAQYADALGMHAMVYINSPYSFKRAMFREAQEIGASSIRLDVPITAIVTDPNGGRDWHAFDEDLQLAREYGLQPVAILQATPYWLAACPPDAAGRSYRCAPSDPEAWAAYVGEIVRHAGGAVQAWEVVNEPTGRWTYLGTPEQYAAQLAATHAAIKAADPSAKVLIGSGRDVRSERWMARVLDALGPDPSQFFEIGNVHARGSLVHLGDQVASWKRLYSRYGFDGPIWVTEHGYPADPRFQYDRGYRDGAASQAAYLSRSVPALVAAGAARVFVTERDNLGGRFASEGVLGGAVADPVPEDPRIVRKPAFFALRRLVAGR